MGWIRVISLFTTLEFFKLVDHWLTKGVNMKAPKTDLIRKAGNCYADEAFPNLYHGMCEYAISNGSFSLIDLLDYILEFTGKAHMDISTWVASYASVRHVEDFLEENHIHNFRFVVDRGFLNTRKVLYNQIRQIHGDVIAVTSNHAKFTIIYNDEYNFVIETSANLNKNNRLENFRITENKEYCDFFRNVFNQIFSLHKSGNLSKSTINEIFA